MSNDELWKEPPAAQQPGWWRRLQKARGEAKTLQDAWRVRRDTAQEVPVVRPHVPWYPSEPVVRPQRHRRNLKGRFRP